MDWPAPNSDDSAPIGLLSTGGPEAPFSACLAAANTTMHSSAAWPVANLAIYQPVIVRRPLVVYNMGWFNGATASGNVDVGIYDQEWTQLAHSGSTAQGTISALQMATTGFSSPIALPIGRYYFALAMDNTTGTVQASNLASAIGRVTGIAQQATAFVLPGTATPAALTNSRYPIVVAVTNPAAVI